MRTLYHFPLSPFSRRTRLALAHKGLTVSLKDGRADPSFVEEARKLWPLRTMPVLVEEDGTALGDSGAILRYLDAAYPSARPLWPAPKEAMRTAAEVAALTDGALDLIINTATRYYALHEDGAWGAVRDEIVGRAQAALDRLAALAKARGRAPLTGSSMDDWCAPDMMLYTAIVWLAGLPARAPHNPTAAILLSLGWSLPADLARWAEAFHDRADVRALGPAVPS
jgi:glutathione S-transferase